MKYGMIGGVIFAVLGFLIWQMGKDNDNVSSSSSSAWTMGIRVEDEHGFPVAAEVEYYIDAWMGAGLRTVASPEGFARIRFHTEAYGLTVWARDQDGRVSSRESVTPSAGSFPKEVLLILREAPVLTVEVVGQLGVAATIEAKWEDFRVPWEVKDAPEGVAVFSLPPGTYAVNVFSEGEPPIISKTVEVGWDSVSLTVEVETPPPTK